MIVLLGVAVTLAALLIVRPRLALWIGLAFPAVQAFYSAPLLRFVVLGALAVGIALVWSDTIRRQRYVVSCLWLGIALTLALGWLLSVDPSRAQGVVVNVVYAGVVASLAVVNRISASEWSVYFMSWGVFVSAWLTTHDIVVTGRTGSLYIGENANALGMFAALGVVGGFALAMRRPFRVAPILVGAPVTLFCALGVVSSASRGALMVAAAGITVRILAPALTRSRGRAVVALAVFGVAAVWLTVPVMTWFLAKAGRNIGATTNFDSREQILHAAIQAGLDHPVAGTGFGGLAVNDIGVFGPVSVHNAYVGLFAATGVIPSILLGMLVLSALTRARLSDQGRLLPLVVAAVVIGFSLDWVPTAKLGPIALSLLACGAALSGVSAANATGPLGDGADTLQDSGSEVLL